ncbi:MAG: ferritin family protein [Candidatus Omnitrophica bacterium]|nr:ferritin family protein [Candidatus Omnitrophota bacterium]
MAVFFDVSEIFQFAIRIEENGESFYRKVAEKSSEKEVNDLFTFLADEEARHKKIFEDMVGRIANYEPSETYPGEYFQYLKSYADTLVFPPEIERELETAGGVVKALDFGIRRELDSIMYYLETKDIVPETQHKIMDKIIDEERSHFVRLSKMKERFAKE